MYSVLNGCNLDIKIDTFVQAYLFLRKSGRLRTKSPSTIKKTFMEARKIHVKTFKDDKIIFRKFRKHYNHHPLILIKLSKGTSQLILFNFLRNLNVNIFNVNLYSLFNLIWCNEKMKRMFGKVHQALIKTLINSTERAMPNWKFHILQPTSLC